MPQMMPLNWLTLMIFFIIIFYIFYTMNYYFTNIKFKTINLTSKNNKMPWKW